MRLGGRTCGNPFCSCKRRLISKFGEHEFQDMAVIVQWLRHSSDQRQVSGLPCRSLNVSNVGALRNRDLRNDKVPTEPSLSIVLPAQVGSLIQNI